MQVIKDVTIGTANYRIAKMSAKTGSWLLMLLMGKMLKVMQENKPDSNQQQEAQLPEKEQTEAEKLAEQEAAASAAISFMLMNLDEATYAKVQSAALNCCMLLQVNGAGIAAPIPIVMYDGQFAVKELEYDIETVLQLMSKALFLNLSPFFTSGKLMGLVSAN